MTFEPPACPNPDACPSQSREVPFACRPAGWFSRKCDGLIVQRFRCCVCGKRFSEQTFKATYRQKRPELNEPCFRLFVAKVTMRQASRTLLCNRKSIRRRVLLLGDIGEATHGHFAPKRELLLRRLTQMGVRVDAPPAGAFYVWGSVDRLPEGLNTGRSFFRQALERQVITVPGEFFDVNPGNRRAASSARFANHLRFSFGPSIDVLDAGLSRLDEMVREASAEARSA